MCASMLPARRIPQPIASDPVHDLPGTARQADENAARSSKPALLPLEPHCLAYIVTNHRPSAHQPSHTKWQGTKWQGTKLPGGRPSRPTGPGVALASLSTPAHLIRLTEWESTAYQMVLHNNCSSPRWSHDPDLHPLPPLPSLWTDQCPGAPSHGACAEAMSTTTCTCRTPRDRIAGRLLSFLLLREQNLGEAAAAPHAGGISKGVSLPATA